MSSTQEPSCQLNTTECILQAAVSILTELQDNNNKHFNWDPLSFGVTLVIGIIALFFAALTIGQGLLAAGPGRHKSSSYALGPWADLTSRQFDFRELRFRNIAYTPILSRLRINTDLWPDMEEKLDEPMPLKLPPHWDGAGDPKNKSKDIKEYFPATWLALVTLTLTDDPMLWSQKAIGTDYMPSDLPAAPAYATVADLVVMSCLAAFPDTPKLLTKTESGIPSVQCPEFQLVFRTHPLLGTFGLFQTYNPRSKPALKFRPEMLRRLKLSFCYASGYIPSRCVKWTPFSLSLSPMLLTRTVQNRACMGFAKDLVNCQSRGDVGKKCCARLDLLQPCWCPAAKNEDAYHFFRILRMSPAPVMSASYYDFPPIAYPTRTNRIRENVMPLLCLSRLWSLSSWQWKGMLFHDTETPGSRLSMWNVIAHDTINWELSCTNPRKASSPYPWEELSKDLRPYEAFKAYCAGPEEWAMSLDDSVSILRESILNEIVYIDRWLDTYVHPDVFRCRAASLSVSSGWCGRILALCYVKSSSKRPLQFVTSRVSNQVNELLDKLGYLTGSLNLERSYIDEERQEEEERLRMGNGDTWPTLGSGFESAKDELSKIYQLWELEKLRGGFGFRFSRSVQHPLDDLLIYRTFLFAMLFELATDVSDIVESQDCNRIIPIF